MGTQYRQPPKFAWRKALQYGGSTPLVAFNGMVFSVIVEEHQSALAGINVQDGTTVWERAIRHWPSSPTCPPMVIGDLLYYGSYDDLLVLDPATGREVHRCQLPDGTYVTAPPSMADNLLLVPTASWTLLALDRRSLDVVWESERATGSLNAKAVAEGNRIYLAAMEEVWCLERQTGKIIWRGNGGERTLPFLHRSSVLVDRLIVPVGRQNRAVLALRKSDGSRVWRTLLEGDRPGSEVIYGFDSPCLPHHDVVLCGSTDGCLYALAQSDGRVLWRTCTGGAVLAPPLLAGDTLLFGSSDGTLNAVEPTDGHLGWSVDVGGAVWDTPVLEQETVLVTSLQITERGGAGWLVASTF